jgi:hypothetical protein
MKVKNILEASSSINKYQFIRNALTKIMLFLLCDNKNEMYRYAEEATPQFLFF